MLRRSTSDRNGSAARILVVNDNEGGCELIARILETAGYEAVRIHSHNDALLALNRASQPVGGVIIDFTSGSTAANLKLLDSVRHGDEANREVPVFVLSASGANRLFAFQQGTDSFMVRPFHANELVDEVRAVLGRSFDERMVERHKQLRAAQSA